MGIKQKATQMAGGLALTKFAAKAPVALSHGFVREALQRAIKGIGPLPSARVAAEAKLAEAGGSPEKAIKAVIERHAALAGGQGFLTNLGGLTTLPLALPANISGLAVVQIRMIAIIAHLRGYDVSDPRTQNAILASLLGKEKVNKLVLAQKIPAPPMALATAPMHDPGLDQIIASEVAAELIALVGGRRLLTTAGRRVPIMGGAVGASADALATWQVGRYASRELRPRNRR